MLKQLNRENESIACKKRWKLSGWACGGNWIGGRGSFTFLVWYYHIRTRSPATSWFSCSLCRGFCYLLVDSAWLWYIAGHGADNWLFDFRRFQSTVELVKESFATVVSTFMFLVFGEQFWSYPLQIKQSLPSLHSEPLARPKRRGRVWVEFFLQDFDSKGISISTFPMASIGFSKAAVERPWWPRAPRDSLGSIFSGASKVYSKD